MIFVEVESGLEVGLGVVVGEVEGFLRILDRFVKIAGFGVGGGEWADTGLIPDAIAISTKVMLVPAK